MGRGQTKPERDRQRFLNWHVRRLRKGWRRRDKAEKKRRVNTPALNG